MKYIHEILDDLKITDALPVSGCPVKPGGWNKVNILALGDVGMTMLTGLLLLGGDVISDIGIMDIRLENLERLEMEMNQVGYPFGIKNLPPVHIVTEDTLFDCDLMIFCASKGIPPLESDITDVRMAQLEANRKIIAHYAGLARTAEYKGMIAVVSDPVDNLAAAFLDSSGLEPWQIHGYGLGVMNKRAEYYANKVKKENGTLNIMDGFVNGAMTGDDTWKGSLIGSLVGILGGPLGVLLGGSMGMLIGGAVDANDMAENASLLEKAGDSILDGETAIILLAQEEYETALTAKLNNFDVSITRFDAAEVAAEVEHAREIEKQMAKEAREKLRAERSETFKETVAKKSEELKNWFSNLGK